VSTIVRRIAWATSQRCDLEPVSRSQCRRRCGGSWACSVPNAQGRAGRICVVLAASAVQGGCATQHVGSLVCWNMVFDGTVSMKPVSIADTGVVVTLAAGSAHGCARRGDRSVVWWKCNDYGRLCNGTAGRTLTAWLAAGAPGTSGRPLH
jgi:hypothetical protein